jgi:hypothetical protein
MTSLHEIATDPKLLRCTKCLVGFWRSCYRMAIGVVFEPYVSNTFDVLKQAAEASSLPGIDIGSTNALRLSILKAYTGILIAFSVGKSFVHIRDHVDEMLLFFGGTCPA